MLEMKNIEKIYFSHFIFQEIYPFQTVLNILRGSKHRERGGQHIIIGAKACCVHAYTKV